MADSLNGDINGGTGNEALAESGGGKRAHTMQAGAQQRTATSEAPTQPRRCEALLLPAEQLIGNVRASMGLYDPVRDSSTDCLSAQATLAKWSQAKQGLLQSARQHMQQLQPGNTSNPAQGLTPSGSNCSWISTQSLQTRHDNKSVRPRAPAQEQAQDLHASARAAMKQLQRSDEGMSHGGHTDACAIRLQHHE